MIEQTLPPVRVTHRRPATGRPGDPAWEYDIWGRHGRPVVLLPAILFSRASWWPLAADLRPHATVIAVDLPGHGGSARRSCYRPGDLVDELAALIAHLAIRQAPVIVAHASSAGLAELFATRYATHAVVIADPAPPPGPDSPVDPAGYLHHLQPAVVPAQYRPLADPIGDAGLLAAYHDCRQPHPASVTRGGAGEHRLTVHSRPPSAGPGRPRPGDRVTVYGVPGRFPQLNAVERFAADIRTVLQPRDPSAPPRPEGER